MRHLWQRIVGWMAVYTIVLQTFSVGLLPSYASNSAADPLSVICLNATTGDTQNGSPGTPHVGHGCDHCVLCSATTPPPAPDNATTVSFRAPVLAFSWPPTALPARKSLQDIPDFPTGPPQAN